MSKLKYLSVDIKDTYELVRQNIYDCKIAKKEVKDMKWHHNTQMKNVSSIIKNGILSKIEQIRLEGRQLTEKEQMIFSDEGHVNGIDHVSVSTMECDFSKMYRDEEIYDPYYWISADIIISKDIKARRSAYRYYNEFLVKDKIPKELFNSIDTRILQIKDFNFFDDRNEFKNKAKMMIEYYNYLRDIALAMKENNLDIPLRETIKEDDFITLDPEKLIKKPILILK